MASASANGRSNIYKQTTLDSGAVVDAVERKYGFVVDKVVRQKGFCDHTYHIVGIIRRCSSDYIFKVFMDPYTGNQKQVEAEINMMRFLASNEIPVPRIVPTKEGHLYIGIDFSCGRPNYVRLQTFIKGCLLRDIPVTADICKKLGTLAGKVDVVLEKFSHPFYEANEELTFVVNYDENEKMSGLLPYFRSSERAHKLTSAGFEMFEAKITPNLSRLPIQQIHADLDVVNTIVNLELPDTGGISQLGLIDFADSRRTLRVYEPAISITSILAFGQPDPFDCARSFLDAYRAEVSMTELELELLRPCVIARLAETIALHEYCSATDSRYDGYLLRSCGPVIYDLLERFLADEQNNVPFL